MPEALTLIDLFDGRRDAWFSSDALILIFADDEDQWLTALTAHELQQSDIGVYPRRDDGLCKWGCVDIDTGDFSEALAVWQGLVDSGVNAWIATSKSKGFHVWVFVDEWVEAHLMRAVLVEVVHLARLNPKTEINPKQVKPTQKKVGNCVRIPYGKWAAEHPGRGCMILSPNGESRDFGRDEFLSTFEFTSRQLIEKLGETVIERQRTRSITSRALEKLRSQEQWTPPFAEDSEHKGGHNQRAWQILHGLDRAADGERNICAFVIACHLKGRGTPHEQARQEMTVAVQRSFDRGDEFVDEAIRTLDNVYRQSS